MALDLRTGRIIWRVKQNHQRFQPQLSENNLVVGTWDGELLAFARDDGEKAWSVDSVVSSSGKPPWEIPHFPEPVIHQEIVVRSVSTDVAAFDAESVKKLGPGARLMVVAYSEVMKAPKGLPNRWFEVTFDGGRGHIWGGALATHSEELDLNGDGRAELVLEKVERDEEARGYGNSYGYGSGCGYGHGWTSWRTPPGHAFAASTSIASAPSSFC